MSRTEHCGSHIKRCELEISLPQNKLEAWCFKFERMNKGAECSFRREAETERCELERSPRKTKSTPNEVDSIWRGRKREQSVVFADSGNGAP